MNHFAAVQLFVAVVQNGNFSAAARKHGVTPSSITRQIGRLESLLGTQLLNRTTRRMRLTEAGQVYYERALRLVREFEELNQAVTDMEAKPAGVLRVSAPNGLGASCVAPLLPEFLELHSGIRIELLLDDRVVDLVDDGIDLAIRIATELPDSSLVSRRLTRYRRLICASPDYLAARGTPVRASDLADHECLTFMPEGRSDLRQLGGAVWYLSRAGEQAVVPVSGRLDSNNRTALIKAALAGFGLILAPSWQVAEHLASGALQVVLADYEVDPNAVETQVFAVYVPNRHLSPKVRVFLDFLADRLRATEAQAMAA